MDQLKNKRRKMKSLTIIGREWCNRAGSYQSTEVIVDGATVYKSLPIRCYGEHYLTMAADWMAANGYLKREVAANGSSSPLWVVCQDNNVVLNRQLIQVARERDL